MSKINPDLQQLLDDAGPGTSSPLRLIVTLEPGDEWHRAVEAVKAAGLHVEREEQAIHVLFGSALAEQVPAIATLSGVELVESEGLASTR